jgi:hypothetical protein
MRRFTAIIAAALCTLSLLACEDGPNQTYLSAPPGAANTWNDGKGDAAVVSGTQGFDAGYPTTNATALCSTDFKRERWAWMLTQPIKPPRFYAGLDMAGNDQWDGLRIEDAENPPAAANSPWGGLCQSVAGGSVGSCPSGFGDCNGSTFGNAGEVTISWNVANHMIDQMILGLGYTGAMQTDSYPDHLGEVRNYTVAIGDVVRRDGAPWQLQWNDNGTIRQQITDIFNAAMSTFAVKGGVPFDTSECTTDKTCSDVTTGNTCQCKHDADDPTVCETGAKGRCGSANCYKDGSCLVLNDGSTTVFGFRPLVVYVGGTAGVPQPALSTPTNIYNFFSKWEPFSNLPQTVKLDAEGPVAEGTPAGAPPGSGLVCTQKVGMTFDDFRKNCVQVHGDGADPAGVDTVNLNKVLHSLTHDSEHWAANVLGVNQNFTSMKVYRDPNAVILDTDTPQPDDITQDWTFDNRARGKVLNDYQTTTSASPEQRGSGLVFIEWARLLLKDVARILHLPAPKKLGDPACVGFDASGQPNYLSTTGCSGIEGLVVPSGVGWGTGSVGDFDDTAFAGPGAVNLDPGENADGMGFYVSILKPGDLAGVLCIDPGVSADFTSYTDCTQGGSIWGNMLRHVTRVLGRGDIKNLPTELQDRRYYYRWFGVAYIKYLLAYGKAPAATRNLFPKDGGLGPNAVMKQDIDMESLFFDYRMSPGAGAALTFDKFEYIERGFAGQGGGGEFNWFPWNFEYGVDLLAGNQRYDNWMRRMDREEIAMFASMLTDKSHKPGEENNVNITNLFGSAMLGGDESTGVLGTWLTHKCAIGQYSDPSTGNECMSTSPLLPTYGTGPWAVLGMNPPLDVSHMTACGAGCVAPKVCIHAQYTYETGPAAVCATPCNYAVNPATGCAAADQACVVDQPTFTEMTYGTRDRAITGCVDMKMDTNERGSKYSKPLLWYYPGAWSRTPFSRGHSPITIPASGRKPGLGLAMVTIPNFLDGPYTASPALPDASGACRPGWTRSGIGTCNAPLNLGTGMSAPTFSALAPWLEVQPKVGFHIPLDAQHNQWISAGQFDLEGTLEAYLIDYLPYSDPAKPSCVADGVCRPGFVCDARSTCITTDDTVRILGIEGKDFLGQAFVCEDPATGDVLHVGMFDSATSILDWLAAHPGSQADPWGLGSTQPSAQQACQIIVRRSPYDNFVDEITSKANGVHINVAGGQGQGRITDIIVFDPSLIQAL